MFNFSLKNNKTFIYEYSRYNTVIQIENTIDK
jgi:hypothetical protein